MSIELRMIYEEIGDVLASSNEKGGCTYYLSSRTELSRTSMATGIWSRLEPVRLHIPAPSVTAAHFILFASAFGTDRKHVKLALGGHFPAEVWTEAEGEKQDVLESLRKAVYTAFLASFIEGFNIIDQANKEHGWSVDYSAVVPVWRNGCIITADLIVAILADISKEPQMDVDLLHNWGLPTKGIQHNAVVSSLSATLESLRQATNTILPTRCYEAQLIYLGKHMFEFKSESVGRPETGKHHLKWKLAQDDDAIDYRPIPDSWCL
ncbi:MAG: hypothetical protein Q9202_006477 [Teloschistes flavicans]